MIGHEIGHGFDDQGAKYDGDGNLVDWWTDADRTEFGGRTKALIEQYDDFIPRSLAGGDASSHHVNGAFTVGENIGDLGGLSIALLAYQLSLGGEEAPLIDGLTGVQRVFFGWAQVWRTKSRDAEAIRRLAVDPHSPPEFRCNGVLRNIDAFYDAFEVEPADDLFLPTRAAGPDLELAPNETPATPLACGGFRSSGRLEHLPVGSAVRRVVPAATGVLDHDRIAAAEVVVEPLALAGLRLMQPWLTLRLP